jgi:hypothetical protein
VAVTSQQADTCPVGVLQAYLKAAGVESGPLFRGVNRHGQLLPGWLGDRAAALVVKRRAEAIGLDPERFAGHSLRAHHGGGAIELSQRLSAGDRYMRVLGRRRRASSSSTADGRCLVGAGTA